MNLLDVLSMKSYTCTAPPGAIAAEVATWKPDSLCASSLKNHTHNIMIILLVGNMTLPSERWIAYNIYIILIIYLWYLFMVVMMHNICVWYPWCTIFMSGVHAWYSTIIVVRHDIHYLCMGFIICKYLCLSVRKPENIWTVTNLSIAMIFY